MTYFNKKKRPKSVPEKEWKAYLKYMKSRHKRQNPEENEKEKEWAKRKNKLSYLDSMVNGKRKPAKLSMEEWVDYINDLNAKLEKRGSSVRYKIRNEYLVATDHMDPEA